MDQPVGRNATQDLERVRYVTENYEQLQGLKMAPFGSIYFAAAAFYHLQSLWPALLACLLFLGMVSLRPAIDRYYERRFGRVEHRFGGSYQVMTLIAALFLLALVVALSVGGQVEAYVDRLLEYMLTGSPVNLLLLSSVVVYLVLLGLYRRELRFRLHYVFLMALGVGMSFLPLFGILTDYMFSLFLFAGLLATVGGIFDHLLLVRTMKRLPEEEDAEAI